jgi:tRNA (guanine37-N1)-methyltransferase
MRFDVLTLFPGMVTGPFDESIIKRAIERDLVTINVHNIRDWATDKHHITDDYPYGGGAGMVMKPEPVFAAVESVLADAVQSKPDVAQPRIILMTPQGRVFNQKVAEELSREDHIVMVCGRYEGVDERIREHLVTDELSIGDFVLTGGELAAMVIIDAVSRLLPGVLNEPESIVEESHTSGLLEYPQYTRPPVFRGWEIPEILLSGHHAAIAQWRHEQSLLRTAQRRPDLLSQIDLTDKEKKFLSQHLPKAGESDNP